MDIVKYGVLQDWDHSNLVRIQEWCNETVAFFGDPPGTVPLKTSEEDLKAVRRLCIGTPLTLKHFREAYLVVAKAVVKLQEYVPTHFLPEELLVRYKKNLREALDIIGTWCDKLS